MIETENRESGSTLLAKRSFRIVSRGLRFTTYACGLGLLIIFPKAVESPEITLAVSIVCFFAGGTSAVFESDRSTRKGFDLADAVIFGSALACGIFASAAPAAIAVVGRILFSPNSTYGFRSALAEILQTVSTAAAAACIFKLAGGSPSTIAQPLSLPAAFAAAVVFMFIKTLISSKRTYALDHAQSAGMGYLFAATAINLPYFVILAPALPATVFLLLHPNKPKKKTVHPADEPEQSETKEQETQTEHLSLIDQHTGLANKRYLDIFLKQEINRAWRSGQQLTVLMLDIDNMQSIAKDAGEENVNNYLAALGSAISSETREYDLVARYSHDVLVVVLPETEAAVGTDIARRLHKNFSRNILPLRAAFSVGVATYPTHGTTAEDLISSAHHALNRAKFSGKDSVVSCHRARQSRVAKPKLDD